MSAHVYHMEASEFLAMFGERAREHQSRMATEPAYAEQWLVGQWLARLARDGCSYTGHDVFGEVAAEHAEQRPESTRLAWFDRPGITPGSIEIARTPCPDGDHWLTEPDRWNGSLICQRGHYHRLTEEQRLAHRRSMGWPM